MHVSHLSGRKRNPLTRQSAQGFCTTDAPLQGREAAMETMKRGREAAKEGREKRDGVREREKESRGGALHECFASIIKEVAYSKEKERFKIHSVQAKTQS